MQLRSLRIFGVQVGASVAYSEQLGTRSRFGPFLQRPLAESYPSLRSHVIVPCVLDAVEGCVASPSESGNSGASHTCTITKDIGRVVVVHACGRSGLWRLL